MYTRFFGLAEKPFSITPDPRYLFLSGRHAEALAHLKYGLTESGGFVQLTGEVGTGKTTLVRSILKQLPPHVDVALILNPRLTTEEFLTAICEELRMPTVAYHGVKEMIDALNRHLLAAHSYGRRTVLIVDEAQNLSRDVLEQIRLLTNLETAKEKLLQIILIGQPELRDMLNRQDLRQLAQRITGRYHLEPLSRDETTQYVRHRLEIAGAPRPIFTESAVKEIYRLSKGVPRVVNVICDRSLLGAYTNDLHTIDKVVVRKAAGEIQGLDTRRSLWPGAAVAAGFGVAAIGALAIWLMTNSPGSATNGVTRAEPALTQGAKTFTSTRRANDDRPLAKVLADGRDNTGTNVAFANLFGLWNKPYDPGAGRACEQAMDRSLRCFYEKGTWEDLLRLDRPTILSLTDSRGREHQAVLAQIIYPDRAELAIGDLLYEFPLDEISQVWSGDFLLLWRPFSGTGDKLRPGMRGAGVRWLRESLGGTGDPSETDEYDSELKGMVRGFQRENGLDADGIAGPRTLIVLNSELKVPDTPLLSEGG